MTLHFSPSRHRIHVYEWGPRRSLLHSQSVKKHFILDRPVSLINSVKHPSTMFVRNLRPISNYANFGKIKKFSNVSLNLSTEKILCSPFPDVRGYENVLLHESIWDNIHKWPNKTAMVRITDFPH